MSRRGREPSASVGRLGIGELFSLTRPSLAMPPLQLTEPATASGLPSLPSPPPQCQPTQLLEMTGPSDEFWKELHIQDNALTRMEASDYKAWLRTMFSGLARLADKRLQDADPDFRKHKQTSFNRWREQWDSQVSSATPARYRDREVAFLRTKRNFQYLARVLDANSKDWYLVSGQTSIRER